MPAGYWMIKIRIKTQSWCVECVKNFTVKTLDDSDWTRSTANIANSSALVTEEEKKIT